MKTGMVKEILAVNFLTSFFGEITFYNLIAQLIGFLGLALAFISFQQKDHKRMRIFQILLGIPFIVHFFMLGAYTGCVLNFISFCRAIVYYHKGLKKWASGKWWVFVFLAAFTVSIMFTWKDTADILPLAACFIHTIVLYIDSAKLARFTIWPSSVAWLIYNISRGSYAGIVTEVFNLVSIVIGILRHDIKKADRVHSQTR